MTGPDGADPIREQLQRALTPEYTLERELGRGGMGTVYLARDLRLDRPVAIKLLPPELAAQPDLRERFLRETRTAASFSHPNIVPVHTVEDREQALCFVMGFVDGQTLADRVRRGGPMSISDAVRLLQEMAWALSYAHGRGIVHRDIKPDNILIERSSGRSLITDFGISRSLAVSSLTMVGQLVGTPQFMSPEQATGDIVDARSDLYSLGVVGFFALTGRLPFEADSVQAYLAMHVTRTPPPLATLRPDLPPALSSAIDRLLAKDPAARFQSGEQLAEALDPLRAARPMVPTAIRLFRTKTTQMARAALVLICFAPYMGRSMDGSADQLIVAAILLAGGVALLVQCAVGARDLAAAGLGYDDMRRWLGVIAAEEREALEQLRASPQWRRDRTRRWRLVLCAWVVSVGLFFYASSQRVQVGPHTYRTSLSGILAIMIAVSAAMIGLVVVVARSGGMRRLDRGISALWSGPIGRRIFAWATRRTQSDAGSLGATVG